MMVKIGVYEMPKKNKEWRIKWHLMKLIVQIILEKH